MRFDEVVARLPLPTAVRRMILLYHRTAEADALHRYWAEMRGRALPRASIMLKHPGLRQITSDIRRALHPLLPHSVEHDGDMIYCTRRLDMEDELDTLRLHFPRLRYHMIEINCTSHRGGAYRVHINKRLKKIVTLRARRSITL